MLINTLQGNSPPPAPLQESEGHLQELEELPEEEALQEGAALTNSNLKQLCLICGEFRGEKEAVHNSIEGLADEIEIVYR